MGLCIECSVYAFLILVLGSYAPAVFDVWLLCASYMVLDE